MKKFLGNNRGATIAEQLVACLLAAVVITSLYGFYRVQLFSLLSQEVKTATLEDARGALDIMARDLRNAGSWGTGTPPAEQGGGDDPDSDPDNVCNRVYAATKKLIHIQMDLNGDGDCIDAEPAEKRENITYDLAGPTSTCPGPNIIRRNGFCLVSNVFTPAPGKLFSYFDRDNVDLGDNPSREAVKRIKIAFAVQVKNPDPKVGGSVSSMLSTSVELRN